jgi:hypothetical protein
VRGSAARAFRVDVQRIVLAVRQRAILAECRARAHAVEHDLTVQLPPAEEQAIRRWLVGVATVAGAKETPPEDRVSSQ